MTARTAVGQVAILAAATLILAALVLLVVVLVAPRVASRDAFARLQALGAVDQTVALPRAGPGERLTPFMDPAVAAAFCRYDLASSPQRVTAPAPRTFASISFHTRGGRVFYALTDRAAVHGVIEAVLATPDQVRALALHDDEENPSQDLRVAAPESEGYVIFHVFSEAPSLYPEAEADAKRLTCKPERAPP